MLREVLKEKKKALRTYLKISSCVINHCPSKCCHMHVMGQLGFYTVITVLLKNL